MRERSLRCRSCGHDDLRPVVDLGVQPLANNLLRKEDLGTPEPRFPLSLHVCRGCWLMQIADLVPPVDMFTEYLYFTSFSDTMLRHAKQAAERYVDEYALGKDSFVVEVASNDGYFLQNFVKAKVPCLGVEPAANIAKVAREKGIETLVEFFGKATAGTLAARAQADLILGNNVFAHAPDTNDFVAGLGVLLKRGGRIVLEFPYAVDFLDHVEFDTIYHEHAFYFSLTALKPLFARHGLAVFDVERLPIHGGSLRLFVGHVGDHALRPSLAALQAEETEKGLDSDRAYETFSARVADIRTELLRLLAELKAKGKSVAAYGASAKGSTLLNFVQPPSGSIAFIVDRSVHKHGRYSPGLNVPILGTEALLERMPDYTLLLTWNFAEEILAQQKAYRDKGGRFIVPIPHPAIL